MKSTHNNKKRINIILISILVTLLVVGLAIFSAISTNKEQTTNNDNIAELTDDNNHENADGERDNSSDESMEDVEEDVEEERFTNLRISAAGDIMFHSTQINSGYDENSKTYDFKPFFEEVAPILSAADLAIANFESTLAGAEKGYSGYPMFNAPDETVEAIKYAGIDVISTVNNHSLDTWRDGLKRTVKFFNENGIDTVGTYAEPPKSRVLIKEINEIKIAILAYTESTNGLGDQYPPEELNNMLNLMKKERILEDIAEAKQLEADFIITFMHWGNEYVTEPNETQVEYANMMAEAGVDLILGSHPHVIQKSDVIKMENHETFVIYSLGNFISNQRKETLGDHRELTEDGVIVHIDIEKNHLTNETAITNVEYTPTWVYRHPIGGNKYSYKILPITDSVLSSEISQEYKNRMERSYEATMSKMMDHPF